MLWSLKTFILLQALIQLHSIKNAHVERFRDPKTGAGNGTTAEQTRIAFFWITSYHDVPYYYDMSMGSLLGAGASRVDIHIIAPVRSPQIDKYINGSMANKQVIVHIVTVADWIKRIQHTFGVTIPYGTDDQGLGKKLCDFKPLLGALFQDLIPLKVYGYWIYGDNDGLFGSYDNILDYSALRNYDIVAGSSVTANGRQFNAQLGIQSCTGNISSE